MISPRAHRKRELHACVVLTGVLMVAFPVGGPMAAAGQTLQHRKPSPVGAVASSPSADARAALPVAAEGEYRWGESGEVIELYVEDARLRGYLTRRSDRHDANSAPLTFQFSDANTAGGVISFTTSRIHGDWYAFKGRVDRGAVAAPQQDGYYLLHGTLTMHLGAGGPDDRAVGESADVGGVIARQVSLKLTGSGHLRR